ncbi:xylP [Symbiodinium natans]|uniref:XylP protein n=1 Tax=Symbiodinium natans TaxID=878477 RepID=A0A812QTC8_9DINO|nr:xylP [Symbiodinium natans]
MASTGKAEIPPEDRIAVRDKCVVSLGNMVEVMVNWVIMGKLWLLVFNIGFGLSPAILGWLLLGFKTWDAAVDPIIGNLSDNTRTRWGRRRPYIVVFAIITGLVSPMLWFMGSDWSEFAQYAWIVVFGLLLYTSFSLWGMPYYSFMLELTPNYDERTRLCAYRTFFSKLTIPVGGLSVFLVSLPFFGENGESDVVNGVRHISVLMAILIIVFGTLPGVFVKERYYEKASSKAEKESLLKSLRKTFSCKPLWLLCGMVFFNILGTVSIVNLGTYLNLYLINDGQLFDASKIELWKDVTMMAVGIAALPAWVWLSEKSDKKLSMAIVLLSAFVGQWMAYYCINPEYPYLQLIPAAFGSAITGSLWLIVPSMTADIADYDEKHTGLRREGSLNAVFSLSVHVAFALGAGLSGVLIDMTGFDVDLGKEQPAEVLDAMFNTYIWFPIVIWIISLVFLALYQLDRNKLKDIRAELEARRGKL